MCSLPIVSANQFRIKGDSFRHTSIKIYTTLIPGHSKPAKQKHSNCQLPFLPVPLNQGSASWYMTLKHGIRKTLTNNWQKRGVALYFLHLSRTKILPSVDINIKKSSKTTDCTGHDPETKPCQHKWTFTAEENKINCQTKKNFVPMIFDKTIIRAISVFTRR